MSAHAGLSGSHGEQIFVRALDQHHIARMPLAQRRNLAVSITEQQVVFPMAWSCTNFYAGWAFADRPWIGVSECSALSAACL